MVTAVKCNAAKGTVNASNSILPEDLSGMVFYRTRLADPTFTSTRAGTCGRLS